MGSSNVIGGPGGRLGQRDLRQSALRGPDRRPGRDPDHRRRRTSSAWPGGGYLFGTGNPGNGGDGVRIENSAGNVDRRTRLDLGQHHLLELRRRSRDHRRCLDRKRGAQQPDRPDRRRQGASRATSRDGVAVYSPQNTIGPGNVISGNLRGVHISGSRPARSWFKTT